MKRPETVQTEKHEKPKMKKTAVLSRLLPYLMRYKYLMLGAILLTVGGNLLVTGGTVHFGSCSGCDGARPRQSQF